MTYSLFFMSKTNNTFKLAFKLAFKLTFKLLIEMNIVISSYQNLYIILALVDATAHMIHSRMISCRAG